MRINWKFWQQPSSSDLKSADLTPGDCECSHARCAHLNGHGRCAAQFPPDVETPEWSQCACQIYIRDEDEGGEDEPEPDPSVAELEQMFRK